MARIDSLSEVEVVVDDGELRRLRPEEVVEEEDEEEARIRSVRGVRRNA